MADTVLETRTSTLYEDAAELRIEYAGKTRRLVGYATRFHRLSKDLGGFRERILPGAFNAVLASGKDIRALYHHNAFLLLGRTSAGTLRIGVDELGLWTQIDLPDTTYARDVQALVERGDVRGMSFGFKVPPGGDRFTRDAGGPVRELLAIDLSEVTVTPTPAYPDSSVQVRVDPNVAARIPLNTAASLDAYRRKLAILK